MRRSIALWLGLFALYAATLDVDAFRVSDYGGDEPHYLLTAESIVSDGDVDLTDEYSDRSYSDWYPYELDVHGRPTGGRIHEPHGIGYPLLIAPAYALGGPTLVELLMAAIAALAFVLAAVLARRVVPDPWATGGTLAVAASPPAIAYGATVYPELTAGCALAGAALLALRVREEPRMRYALPAATLIAALPWLGTKFLIAGMPILAALVIWMLRRSKALGALLSVEILAGSLIAYVSVNHALYGGLTPYAADRAGQTATDASFPMGYLERLPRLVSLWIDRGYGIVRWAPVIALCFLGAYLLWRSRTRQLARAVPARREAEAAALVALAVCAGQVVVAAFGAPTMYGFWFPGRHLAAALPCACVLAAWGLRHAPHPGAILVALTAVATAWLFVDLAFLGLDGWVAPDSQAPWGPLVDVFPLYGVGSAWADAVAAGIVAGLVALGVREWRDLRS